MIWTALCMALLTSCFGAEWAAHLVARPPISPGGRHGGATRARTSRSDRIAPCDLVRHKSLEQGWRVMDRTATRTVPASGRQTERQSPVAPQMRSPWRCLWVEQAFARAKQHRRTSLGPCMPHAPCYRYGAARANINNSANDRPTDSLPDASSRNVMTKACAFKRENVSSHNLVR